jgi:hypothetical protein
VVVLGFLRAVLRWCGLTLLGLGPVLGDLKLILGGVSLFWAGREATEIQIDSRPSLSLCFWCLSGPSWAPLGAISGSS